MRQVGQKTTRSLGREFNERLNDVVLDFTFFVFNFEIGLKRYDKLKLGN